MTCSRGIWVFFRQAIFFVLFFLLGAIPAFCADVNPIPGATNGTEQNRILTRIWSTRADDITAFLEEADTLQSGAEVLAKPLAADLQSARAQFTRLTGLFQASRGHPTEQLTLVQQMKSLLEQLNTYISPLENNAGTIRQKMEEVATLQKDLREYTSESASDGDLLAEDAAALTNYRNTLNRAEKRLSTASARLESILAPAKSIRDRMTQVIGEIDASLVGIWEDYYLTSSANTLDALASMPALLADWAKSLVSRLAFAYPQSASGWLDVGKNFFLTIFIVGLLSILGLRGAAKLPGHWQGACESVIKKAGVFIGIGLAVLAASSNSQGGIYFAFVLLGALILIAGIAAMSWRLRIAVLPSLEDKPSPLNRLLVPAAIGVLMLFSDLQTRILGIAWGIVMLSSLVLIFSYRRNGQQADDLPLLERISYNCAFWFTLGSLFVSLAGYARMAILLFMVLFALVNTVTLGSAFMGLFEILVDRVLSKTTQPVSNALAQAVAIPVAWVLSLVCTFPWIWAVPGARYLAQQIMSTNYKVGEASFDFSKLLLIVLFFFLFRSFISLARASLEHLPDRMPNIERGAIPPLTNMMTYGLWALFGIIALGMLGVNFTSLAVVAGGLSVGIGFGMQNLFNNLISGLMLIFGRTILVGDYVEVAGAAGTVRAISTRSTTLETAERALIFVPNSAIMSGQLTNWTRNSRLVRRSIVVGVAYGTDPELVSKIMIEAARAQDHVLKMPAPVVYFSNFADSSLEFTLNVFIDDLDNAVPTLSSLRFALDRLFSENNIDIPFPQLTLHMPQGAAVRPQEGDGGQEK